MTTRTAITALASAFLLASCDGSITGPTYEHLSTLSLASGFSCGIDTQGHAFCWGTANDRGQLGNGTNAASAMPVRVQTGARFLQVVTGAAHACGLTTEDRVLCWGDNTQSQVGVTTTDLDCDLLQSNGWVQDFGNACSLGPVTVETGLKFVEIGAGGDRTCGRTSGGTIWCWGASYYGLGDSAGTQRSDSLIRVSAPVAFTRLGVGREHACASDATGQGWCWGNNGSSQLGRGIVGNVEHAGPAPWMINSSAFIARWAIGGGHTCGLTGNGDALCWGAGSSGQRGDSATTFTQPDPTFVTGGPKFTQIAAAGASTCALEAGTGAAWCWGENSDGRLGDGTTADLVSPAQVLGGLSFTRLAMGSEFWYGGAVTTCGASEGEFYCWGLLPQPLTFGE